MSTDSLELHWGGERVVLTRRGDLACVLYSGNSVWLRARIVWAGDDLVLTIRPAAFAWTAPPWEHTTRVRMRYATVAEVERRAARLVRELSRRH